MAGFQKTLAPAVYFSPDPDNVFHEAAALVKPLAEAWHWRAVKVSLFKIPIGIGVMYFLKLQGTKQIMENHHWLCIEFNVTHIIIRAKGMFHRMGTNLYIMEYYEEDEDMDMFWKEKPWVFPTSAYSSD